MFRDGSCHHISVLSSVSASYKGISDLASRFEFTSRYKDIARDLDANLAEADMESFKTEDIHALLMTDLPHDALIDDIAHDVSYLLVFIHLNPIPISKNDSFSHEAFWNRTLNLFCKYTGSILNKTKSS